MEERLGGAVEVDVAGLSETYETHEFILQYQESAWNLLSRWMEHEGIFCFEADGGEGERLVLADSMSNLPFARSGDDGQVRHVGDSAPSGEAEVVFGLRHAEELGVTSVTVAEYDWTNPSLDIREEQSGEFPIGPPPEVYDHTDVATLHRYGGQQYQHNTAARGAQVRHEVLDLMHQRWSMRGNVVTAQPGHVLRVEGAPDGDLDGAYMIVRVESGGEATEGVPGSWKNSLAIVPTSKAFRLPPNTPRPVVPGPETAVVVGPTGQEIHTDEHGRVKVRFHWDRQHGRGAEDSSRWIRVAHNWAGAGFGTFFLPRIGMEVVVMFLGGNPDRPLITSCVYNGENRAGVALPDDKTQSLIRTKSSVDSDGFNEMRFEDKAGSEFIYVHAEKDYNEVVEHCHSTHVKVDQSNTVDHDHTETIGNDQTLEVKGERMKTVHKPETTYIFDTRTETVHGVETLDLRQTRQTTIGEDEDLTIEGNRKMHVDGRDDEEIVGGREVKVSEFDNLKVLGGANRNETISGQKNVRITKKYDVVQGGSEKLVMDQLKTLLESGKEITLRTGSSEQVLKNDGNVTLDAATKVVITVGGCKLEMTTEKITLTAGPTTLELGPSGAKLSGPTVTSSAQTMNEITGLLVKIN